MINKWHQKIPMQTHEQNPTQRTNQDKFTKTNGGSFFNLTLNSTLASSYSNLPQKLQFLSLPNYNDDNVELFTETRQSFRFWSLQSIKAMVSPLSWLSNMAQELTEKNE